MTSYYENQLKPEKSNYIGFHHIEFWVNNAKQAAAVYCARLGFKPLAYRGLETGSRSIASHAIVQNKIILLFSSPLEPNNPKEMIDFLSYHGDEVRDLAFDVTDVDAIIKKAIQEGAEVQQSPTNVESDKGFVRTATIKAFANITHTFVDRRGFKGVFLPGFEEVKEEDGMLLNLPGCLLENLDHVVANQPMDQMLQMTDWYEKVLGFHRFWSIDDRIVHTQFSGLRSMVVSDPNNVVMLTMNEPAKGSRKGQIEEFLSYHGGPGIQHIAFTTSDIITSVRNLRLRGFEFLSVPPDYYTELQKNMKMANVKIKENFDEIMEQSILVDFDKDGGYLLQIVSSIVQDKPTLFLEVIQRHKHQGFGAGNFKNLYTAFEQGQIARGNLI